MNSSNSLLAEYRQMLDDQPVDTRVPEALKAASELVEYAAYEMARTGKSSDVATLILLAADLERRGVALKTPLS
ncbi:MAG: hypothetical protein AAGK92_07925 [Pseudomonadota bacterium]